MKKYLISGLEPGEGGTGDFIDYLSILNNENQFGFEFITPKKILESSLGNRDFYGTVSTISDADIILLHPQSLGFDVLISLVKNRNRIRYYVLDNSFFCIRSYNYHDKDIECFRCLEFNHKPYFDCDPFPNPIPKNETLEFMKQLRTLSSSIDFYSQNPKQTELLKLHFGQDTKITPIGIWTKTLEEIDLNERNDEFVSGEKPKIVYHASTLDAKGFTYFLSLARLLPQYDFFLPVQNYFHIYDFPSNVYAVCMSWDTGLKELILKSDLVICPSLWSAANEAALIKSILLSAKTAVVSIDMGFEKVIPDSLVLKLSKDPIEGSKKICSFFEKPKFNKNIEVSNWFQSYKKSCLLEKLFTD